jgi:putative flippase GtrA
VIAMMQTRGSALRFLAASALAAGISIAVVEAGGAFLPMSLAWVHVAVVSISYFVAARLNFELQRRWVFDAAAPRTAAPGEFGLFVIVNGTMSLLVGALSGLLLRTPPMAVLSRSVAMAASLLVAAAAVAPLSFMLTRHLVRRHAGAR